MRDRLLEFLAGVFFVPFGPMTTALRNAPLLAAALTLFAGCAMETEKPESPANLGSPLNGLVAGQHLGLAYSGFRVGQHPDRGDGALNPSRAELLEDLTILTLHGVRLLRLYDSGSNSRDVVRLIHEEKIPIKVLLGAWLKAEVSNHAGCPWLNEAIPDETLLANELENAAEIDRAIALAVEYPGVITSMSVGNEALVEWNDHMVPLERVLGYVRSVRAAVQLPVTVADNWAWWITDAGQRLAQEVDFLGVHSYPVWEGKAIDVGIASTITDVQRVRTAIPGRTIAVLEAGWASTGVEFGERASEEAQARYTMELAAWAQESSTTVFLFEAFDEPWKGDPANAAGAEKHWGLWNVDRSPKMAAKALRRAMSER